MEEVEVTRYSCGGEGTVRDSARTLPAHTSSPGQKGLGKTAHIFPQRGQTTCTVSFFLKLPFSKLTNSTDYIKLHRVTFSA